MSSVDKKIVQMTFDNAQFERGVKESLASLKQLRESLNFKGATKGMEDVAKATKNFKMDGMAAAIDAVSNRFSTMGIVGMTVIQNLTNSAMNMAKTIITAVPNQIIQGGWSRAMKIEDAKFKIKGLKADWDALYQDMQYAVDGTAYGLDAAASIAAQLSASGVKAGEGMKTALRGVSGVAAMTNSTYEEMGRIFAQVAGAGRLMGQDLLQISSRGINAAATIAEYLTKVNGGVKVTEAEVRQMVSKGQIDFQTFAAAMDDAFGEHAKDANETFAGSLANIRAALSKVGELFAAPVIQEAPKVFNAIRETVNRFKEELKPFAEKIDPVIRGGIQKVADVINVLKDTLAPVEQKVKSATKAAEPVVKVATETAEAVSKTTEEIDKLAEAVMRGNYGNGVDRMNALGDSYAEVQNRVNELMGVQKAHNTTMEETAEVAENTGDALQRTAEETDKVAKKVKVANDGYSLLRRSIIAIAGTVRNLGSMVKSVAEAAGGAVSRVFKMGVGKQITRFLESIHELSKAFVLNRSETKALENTFSGILTIYKMAGDVVLFVARAFMILIDPVIQVGKAFLHVTGFIGDMISKFGEFTNKMDLGNKVLTLMMNVMKDIERSVGDVVDEYVDYLKKNEAVQSAVRSVKDTFKMLRDTILNVTGSIDTSGHKTTVLGTIFGALAKVIGTVVAAFALLLAHVINFSSNIVDAIKNSKIFQGVVNGIKKVVSDLTSVFKLHNVQAKEYGTNAESNEKKTSRLKTVMDAICTTIGNIVDAMKRFAKAFVQLPAVQAIINGVKTAIDALYPVLETAFTNTINWAADLIEKLSGIRPGDFDSNMAIINKAITGVSDGFKTAGESISDFFSRFTNGEGIIGRFAQTLGMSKVEAKGFKDEVADFAGNGGGSGNPKYDVTQWFKNTARAITDFNSKHNVLGKGVAIGITAALYKVINDTTKALGAAAHLPKKIGDFFGSLESVMGQIALDRQAARRRATIRTIIVSIGLLGAMVAALGMIPAGQLRAGLDTVQELTFLVGAIYALFYGVQQIPTLERTNDSVNGMVKSLLKMSGVLLILTVVAKELSKVGEIKMESIIAVSALFTLVGTVMGIMATIGDKCEKVNSKINVNSIAQTIAIAGSVYLLVLAMKKASSMSGDEINRGLKAVIPCVISMVAIVRVAGTANATGTASVKGAIGCAVAIYLLILTMKKAAKEDSATIYKGFVNMLPAIGALVLCMKAAKAAGKEAKGVGTSMLAASGAILLMIECIKLANSLTPEEAVKGGLVVGAIGTAMTIMLRSMRGTHFDKGSAVTMLAVAGLIVAVLGELIALTFVDTGSLLVATGAVIGVIVALGQMCKHMSLMVLGVEDLKVKDILKLSIILGMISGVLALLIVMAKNPWQSIVAAAAGMSAVMIALGATFNILAKTDGRKVSKQKMTKFLEMCAPLLAIAVALGFLSKYGGSWDKMAASAIGLSTVLGAMAGVFYIISITKTPDIKTITTFGIAMTAIGGVTALIVGLLSNLGGDPAEMIAASISLSNLLIAFGGVFAVLSIIGNSAKAAVKAAFYFDVVVAIITGLVLGIAWVLEKLDDGNKGGKIAAMMELFKTFAGGLGEAMGMLVENFSTHMINLIPKIGSAVDKFIENVMPGLQSLGALPANTLAGAKALAATLLVFGAATFVEAITNFNPISKYLARKSLADAMNKIAEMVVNFDDKTKGISKGKSLVERAEAAKDLVTALSKLPKDGGFLSLMTGKTDWASATKFITALAKSLTAFDKDTKKIDSGNVNDKVKLLGTFIKTLRSVPTEGGLMGMLFGSKKDGFKAFSSGMKALGGGLLSFQTATVAVDEKVCKKNIKLLGTLVDTLSKCGTEGGLLGMVLGSKKNAFDAFEQGMTGLAVGMSDFADITSGINAKTFNKGLKALDSMLTTLKKVPNKGGLLDSFFGGESKDFSGVSFGLIGLAEGMAVIADVSSKIKDYKKFTQFVNAIDAVFTALKKGADVKMPDFQSISLGLASAIAKGVAGAEEEALKAGERLWNAVKKGFYHPHKAKDAADEMGTNFVKGISGKKKGCEAAGTALYNAFRSGAYHPNKAMDLGGGVSSGYVRGVNSGVIVAINAGKSLYNAVASNCKGDLYPVGANMAQGYVDGIMSKLNAVAKASNKLGKKTIEELKKKLDIRSPSRVGRWIGQMFAEGPILGMQDKAKSLGAHARSMGEQMVSALQTAIDMAKDIAFDDLNPVITPTFDMSNVKAVRSDLKDIFGTSLNGSISTLNAIHQNGSTKSDSTSMATPVPQQSVVNYTQNNYSPKALSRYDIYKQTRRQLSSVERLART